jgi:hypothetical protein
MHPDAPKPDATDDDVPRLLQEGLDPIESPPAGRAALWRRIAQRILAHLPAPADLQDVQHDAETDPPASSPGPAPDRS